MSVEMKVAGVKTDQMSEERPAVNHAATLNAAVPHVGDAGDTDITETHFTFPSALAGSDVAAGDASAGSAEPATVHAVRWMPAPGQPVRGVVQITHGMCEYIERYNDFARFLAACGFAVCGQDNIGHGKTAASPDEWGHIPARGGKKALIENLHTLRGIMMQQVSERVAAQNSAAHAAAANAAAASQAAGAANAAEMAGNIQSASAQVTATPANASAATAFADVPYFMFGHSMGSFITRNYLSVHAEGLAGAIICGTGHQTGATVAAGLAAARLIARAKGERHRSDVLFNLADGAYGKAIKNARTEADWLSTNPAVVDAYLADPACGFRFSAGAYIALMELLSDLSKKNFIARIPQSLPLFLIAGTDDPVGDRGRGVARVYKEYKEAGIRDVDMRLYMGMRHEILNETEHEKVYNDVLKWLEGHL